MLTRRQLITGALACLLAPTDLTESHRKIWALGGLPPIEFPPTWFARIGIPGEGEGNIEWLRVEAMEGRSLLFLAS